MGPAYSEEFKVKVGVHQGSVLSPLLFAIVVDVITENARRGVVNELLYADDLVFMNKTMEDFKERFWNCKDALENKGLKVNTRKTKVMVSQSEGEPFKFKIDVEFVREESWPIQGCAQNMKTRFMADVQK